jgi:hypothetical protein
MIWTIFASSFLGLSWRGMHAARATHTATTVPAVSIRYGEDRWNAEIAIDAPIRRVKGIRRFLERDGIMILNINGFYKLRM